MKPEGRADAAALIGAVAAYGAFAATFLGPRERFWQRMTRTGAVLGSIAIVGEPDLVMRRPRPRDLALGAGIAASLYGVFRVGDRVARLVLPRGAREIGDIYRLRKLRPRSELAARLALVVAPAEEIFWRGLLLRSLTRRLGRSRGAAVAAGLYGGAHLCTGNLTLVGAATVAGTGWSALAAAGVPMPALVVSHAIWDVWIFLIQPTERESGSSAPE